MLRDDLTIMLHSYDLCRKITLYVKHSSTRLESHPGKFQQPVIIVSRAAPRKCENVESRDRHLYTISQISQSLKIIEGSTSRI